MYIQDSWRILTIGDGDLSFSQALIEKHPGIVLYASVLDCESEIREKYQLNAIDSLQDNGHKPVFEVDVTKTESFKNKLAKQFDLVIFQFPLVPNAGPRKPGQSWHQGTDSNLLNRKLLHTFLIHCAEYFLDDEGARLSYITSKEVKPYCDWHIESLGNPGPLSYLGKMPFNPDKFQGYRIRNVDRDKQVKSTAAITYIWTDKDQPELNTVVQPPAQAHTRYCALCHIGPVDTAQDWTNHLNSRQHRRRAEYQANWEQYLNQKGDSCL